MKAEKTRPWMLNYQSTCCFLLSPAPDAADAVLLFRNSSSGVARCLDFHRPVTIGLKTLVRSPFPPWCDFDNFTEKFHRMTIQSDGVFRVSWPIRVVFSTKRAFSNDFFPPGSALISSPVDVWPGDVTRSRPVTKFRYFIHNLSHEKSHIRSSGRILKWPGDVTRANMMLQIFQDVLPWCYGSGQCVLKVRTWLAGRWWKLH